MSDVVLGGNANWSTCNGGSPPGATDNVYLNGFILTLDTATDNSFTCALIKACAADGVTATNGTMAITPAAITLNAELRAGLENLLTIAAAKTVTINGTVYGRGSNVIGVDVNHASAIVSVTEAVASSNSGGYGLKLSNGTAIVGIANGATANSSSCPAVQVFGGNLTVTTALGSTTGASPGVMMSSGAGGTATVTNATGGTGHGVVCAIGHTATVTNATGGTAANVAGVSVQGGTCTVAVAKGGTHSQSPGAAISSSGTLTVNGTDLSGVGPPVGFGTLKLAAGVLLRYSDEAGNDKEFCGTGDVVSADFVLSETPRYSASATTGNMYIEEGTYPTTATSKAEQLATDLLEVDAAIIVDSEIILGITGTYPTTATSKAEQFVDDTAAVDAKKQYLLETKIILGITGTYDPGADLYLPKNTVAGLGL